ncbi:DUF805 domain-containing protein [Devosia sp. SL43]|uniref:DUF805 domain-containing protein n=1 Tax=Devosia sp. SL43 TaxID=2806348 RepID=UPI001F188297|nr:DUF805 domain-containing protein [Devosia sp. SL43]UJW85989.1 DUF805 domain-containing protein [Devosia sp. SL43]
MRSYFDGMLRYFEFSGRSTRLQYWMFFVVSYALFAVAIYADYRMGGYSDPEHLSAPLTLFALFAHIVPGLTVQVRRLHDIGKSGAWYLLHFVPLGGLVLLYWACCASEAGTNYYDGPAPSTYEPRYKTPVAPRRSTIPRDIRMGNAAARPQASAYSLGPATGRFI